MSDIMMERWKTAPMPHQIEGVQELTSRVNPEQGRILPGCLMIGDTMRMGKTKQVIDAVHVLHARGEIDRALVIATNSGKDVWWNPDFGEIKKHSWDGVNVEATLIHAKDRTWTQGDESKPPLTWYVTNYEYVRNGDRTSKTPVRMEFTLIANSRTVLVLDESSAIKTHDSITSRACRHLRLACPYFWLLNGTPLDDSPEDAFAQCLAMSPNIIGSSFITHFRARYANVSTHKTPKGRKYFTVDSWKNLEDLKARIKPYILRRPEHLAKLPPVLDPITITARLEPRSWDVYKEVRDDFVHWADSTTSLTAAQAGVRIMRLAQVASGFLAGLTTLEPCPGKLGGTGCDGDDCDECGGARVVDVPQPSREIGREKTSAVITFIRERYAEEPDLKVVVWSRFRDHCEQMYKTLQGETALIHFELGYLWGGQSKQERETSLKLLYPGLAPKGPAGLVGTTQTGAMSLNLSAAPLAIYAANDYFLRNRLQSEARIRMTGQTRPVQHVDVIAEGPKGQKTVDHIILKALRAKRELVDSMVNDWVREIREED